MADKTSGYDFTKRAKAVNTATLRAVVALYIAYLGYSIIRGVRDGSTTMSPALGWTAGIVFICAAAAVLIYSWKRWRAEVEAARLPESALADEADDE